MYQYVDVVLREWPAASIDAAAAGQGVAHPRGPQRRAHSDQAALQRAALAAARLGRAGLAVVGVEVRLVGGECPSYACVPTKMMLRAADALGEARRVAELAGSAQVRPDWAPVAARIRAEATDNWDDTSAVQRFEKAGGRFVRGRARITAPGEVTVSTSD